MRQFLDDILVVACLVAVLAWEWLHSWLQWAVP